MKKIHTRRKNILCYIAMAPILVILLLGGCATYYGGDRYQIGPELPDARQTGVLAPWYYGYGEAENRDDAEKRAETDALFRAASVLLEDAALLYGERIEQVIQGFPSHDPYILSESRRIIDWSRENGVYQVIVGVRVNLDALAARIAREGIRGGRIIPGVSGLRLPDEQQPEIHRQEHLRDVLSRPERIWKDTEKPVFLVYHKQTHMSDPGLSMAAVASANTSLSNYGMPYIAYDQVQEILKDQDLAFSDVTGRESTLRWIASRFRNDYYIDVSFQTSARQTGASRYEGEAFITLTCYDSFTAEGIASVVHQTGALPGATAAFGARIGAVQKGMDEAMEKLMQQISGKVVAQARSGEQFELVIINSFSDRIMRQFAQQLGYRVNALRRSSFSLDESRYVLVHDGSLEELEDIIYETASLVPGLSDMYLVYQRGNSLTYDTGL